MAGEMVTIPKAEYVRLKQQANIDLEFLKELLEGLSGIKAGQVERVR